MKPKKVSRINRIRGSATLKRHVGLVHIIMYVSWSDTQPDHRVVPSCQAEGRCDADRKVKEVEKKEKVKKRG